MPHSAKEIEAVIWTDARCAALVGEVLGRMGGVRVLAIGGPHKAQLTALAESFDTRSEDDLRKMLVDRPAGFLLLAAEEGPGASGLEQARKSGTVVLAVEPAHAQVDQVGGGSEGRRGEPPPGVMIAPWMRMSPAWQTAAEPQQALGPIHSLHLVSLAPPHVGSLYARLYDAADMLVHLMGTPATIDAALTGPLTQPPENLRGLTGHLTAHLRFGDAAAVLHVSDRSAAWTRRLTAIGADGQLILDDAGYRLMGAEGREFDRLAPPEEPPDPAGLIVHQWRRLIDHPHTPPPTDPRRLIACCQAALLSCRTGEPESPETLLHLRGA